VEIKSTFIIKEENALNKKWESIQHTSLKQEEELQIENPWALQIYYLLRLTKKYDIFKRLALWAAAAWNMLSMTKRVHDKKIIVKAFSRTSDKIGHAQKSRKWAWRCQNHFRTSLTLVNLTTILAASESDNCPILKGVDMKDMIGTAHLLVWHFLRWLDCLRVHG